MKILFELIHKKWQCEKFCVSANSDRMWQIFPSKYIVSCDNN